MDDTFMLGNEAPERSFAEQLLDADAEILADLQAVGINLVEKTPAELAAADQLTLANRLFASLAQDEAEIEALKGALQKEAEILTLRYQRLVDQVAGRGTRKRQLLEQIARFLFPDANAKKKSVALPYGALARKDLKPTVALENEAAFIDAAIAELADGMKSEAERTLGQFVRVTVKLPLTEAGQYFTPSELAACKREVTWGALKKTLDAAGPLPVGVVPVPAQTKYTVELTEG